MSTRPRSSFAPTLALLGLSGLGASVGAAALAPKLSAATTTTSAAPVAGDPPLLPSYTPEAPVATPPAPAKAAKQKKAKTPAAAPAAPQSPSEGSLLQNPHLGGVPPATPAAPETPPGGTHETAAPPARARATPPAAAAAPQTPPASTDLDRPVASHPPVHMAIVPLPGQAAPRTSAPARAPLAAQNPQQPGVQKWNLGHVSGPFQIVTSPSDPNSLCLKTGNGSLIKCGPKVVRPRNAPPLNCTIDSTGVKVCFEQAVVRRRAAVPVRLAAPFAFPYAQMRVYGTPRYFHRPHGRGW